MTCAAPPPARAAKAVFFAWQADQVTAPAPYAPTPILTNDPAQIAAVDAALAQRAGADPAHPAQPLAIRVPEPLTNSSAIALLAKYRISYVFATFSGASAASDASDLQSLSQQLQQSQTSARAKLGEYGIAASSTPQGTAPTNLLTMYNPVLTASGSDATSTFAQDVTTLSDTSLTVRQQHLGNSTQTVPYVTPYAWSPTDQSIVGAIPTLSTGQFGAMLIHLRFRGASSFQLLDATGGAYPISQMEADAANAWTLPSVQAYFDKDARQRPVLTDHVDINGQPETFAQAGVVESALIEGGPHHPEHHKLAIFLTNLTGQLQTITFDTPIGGNWVNVNGLPGSETLAPNEDVLLQFREAGRRWVPFVTDSSINLTQTLNAGSPNTSPTAAIPEPATGGVVVLLFVTLTRRRRRTGRRS